MHASYDGLSGMMLGYEPDGALKISVEPIGVNTVVADWMPGEIRINTTFGTFNMGVLNFNAMVAVALHEWVTNSGSITSI